MRSLCRFSVIALSHALCIWLSLSHAQYASLPKYTLDPFFGTYDMVWEQQVDMISFIGGILGVPLNVTLGGERQTFNKTADGKYQQTIRRSDPRLTAVVVFELDKPDSVQIPGTNPQQSLRYTFTMQNATTLLGSYVFDFVVKQVVFTAQFAFYPDASGYFNTITVTKPESSAMVSTAPFYRIKNGDVGPVTLGPPAA